MDYVFRRLQRSRQNRCPVEQLKNEEQLRTGEKRGKESVREWSEREKQKGMMMKKLHKDKRKERRHPFTFLGSEKTFVSNNTIISLIRDPPPPRASEQRPRGVCRAEI